MKYILSILLLSLFFVNAVFAWSPRDLQSANFVAEKGIINDNAFTPINYKLDSKITRREMLKVMMKLSGKSLRDTCLGAFSDLSADDWGCKYAESAVKEGYIAANNKFRPNDNVTQIEALKMIMQAIDMQRDANDDWRAGYVSKATRDKLIDDEYFDYNKSALRGWIFSNVARSYDDFTYQSGSDVIDDPAIDELLNTIFDL